MAVLFCASLVLLLVTSVAADGQTGQKRALVVGNIAYAAAPLRNAANDARDIDASLTRLGFVTGGPLLNASFRELAAAIDRFANSVKPGDTAFVYFAGHGVQIRGENYLIPIDFRANSEAEVKNRAYSATRLADRLSKSGADLVILVFDACRDNPFRSSGGSRSGRSLADSPGLAAMAVYEPAAAPAVRATAGMLIQFATGSGRTADDNPRGGNGLFASHLLTALEQPGLTVEQIFSLVRQRVNDDSGGQQVPLTMSSVVRPIYFVAPKPAVPTLDNLLERDRLADSAYWEAIRTCASPACYQSYLNRFPDGRYADEARSALSTLETKGASLAAAKSDNAAKLRNVVTAYARAYTALDVNALQRIFPRLPDAQKAAVRNVRKNCRSYSVRVDSTEILQSGEDTALIQAQTTYVCNPATRQGVLAQEMTDLFSLRRTSGGWLIDAIGSLERR
jgi:hypothetical protein